MVDASGRTLEIVECPYGKLLVADPKPDVLYFSKGQQQKAVEAVMFLKIANSNELLPVFIQNKMSRDGAKTRLEPAHLKRNWARFYNEAEYASK